MIATDKFINPGLIGNNQSGHNVKKYKSEKAGKGQAFTQTNHCYIPVRHPAANSNPGLSWIAVP